MQKRKLTTDARAGANSIEQILSRSPAGRTKIFQEIAEGRLKARKLGRRTLILEEDFQDWLLQLPMRDVKNASNAGGPEEDKHFLLPIADRFAQSVSDHTHLVESLLRRLGGFDLLTFVPHLIAEHLFRRQPPPVTRRQAAIHEAGHLIAFELQGMKAAGAMIIGSTYKSGCGGAASASERPFIRPWTTNSNDLLREARVALAGPWAEAVLGDGDVLGQINESLQFRILVTRAAMLKGTPAPRLVTEEVRQTAALVEQNALVINELAQKLMRRRRIARKHCTRDFQKLLSSPAHETFAHSTRSAELADLVIKSAPRVEDFIIYPRHFARVQP